MYLWNLIVITFLFIIIIYISKNQFFFIIHLLLISSYVAQYSGYYLNNFIVNNPRVNKITIAVLFESIPYAVTGVTLSYYKIIDILQKHTIKTLILSIIIYNVIIDYYIFRNIKGINYQGINLNIQSLCVVFIFSLFPSDKIRDKKISKLIIGITKFSAGVYYLHVPVHDYLRYYFDIIKNGFFLGNIFIFLICYIMYSYIIFK